MSSGALPSRDVSSIIICDLGVSNANNNDNNNNNNDDEDNFPVPTIYRCRAPIASLDCMEEFSGGVEAHGPGGAPPTKEQLLTGGLAGGAGAQAAAAAALGPALASRQASVTPGLRYRNLGKSGLRVSNVGLGTWVTFAGGVTEEQAEEVVRLAYDSGINVFDLSEAHSGPRAELELGRILQRRNWKRASYIVTTKVYWNTKSDERGLSRKHLIESVKASLERLQLNYIDVVIVHKADPMCPMEEVVRAMNHVIANGWAMYWGTARWSPVEVMEAYTNCRQFNCVTPICEQAEYHMFCREKTELYMPELYNKIGVGLMAWSPLTMGLVSGRLEDGVPLFSRSSFKNKYSSFSWTEDETASKEVSGGRSDAQRAVGAWWLALLPFTKGTLPPNQHPHHTYQTSQTVMHPKFQSCISTTKTCNQMEWIDFPENLRKVYYPFGSLIGKIHKMCLIELRYFN